MSANNENKVAILVVNGGRDLRQCRWLSLCVGKIIEHTPMSDFHLYIWNNNVEDDFVSQYLTFMPNCSLVQAPPDVRLTHMHADPLQRLYQMARTDGFQYVVTFDSDAHPVSDGWLETLMQALNRGAVVAGVWRDELSRAIPPYVHASCLCTSVDYVERYGLRLDYIASNEDGQLHDTLSSLTETALARDLTVFGLKRSNQRNFHRLMGGVYGEFIYHHGAGSRTGISFWDEKATPESTARNGRIATISAHLLVTDYERYITWLRGGDAGTNFNARMEELASGRLDSFSEIYSAPTANREVLSKNLRVRSTVRWIAGGVRKKLKRCFGRPEGTGH